MKPEARVSGLLWLAFVVSLLVLGFLYGMAANYFDLWPNRYIKQAQVAYETYQTLSHRSFWDFKPSGFMFYDDEGPDKPTVILDTLSGDQGSVTSPEDELILVGGGVLTHRNDYCPDYGCLAWLMDRKGRVLHTWEVDPEPIWQVIEKSGLISYNKDDPNIQTGSDRLVNFQTYMYPNGDLLATYIGRDTYPYGLGMAKFDKDSSLLWVRPNLAHHWFWFDDSDRIYVPGFRPMELPYALGDTQLKLDCPQMQVQEEVILVLDQQGQTIEEISVMDSLVRSGYSGLLFESNDALTSSGTTERDNVSVACDILHLNDVRPLSESLAAEYPDLNPGDLLISMRSLHAVAVLDRDTHDVKWLSAGRTVFQHSPRFMGDNKLLIFDNQGGREDQGGSRVVQLDMGSRALRVVYPPMQSEKPIDFYSHDTGYMELSADRKRVLVAVSKQGRVVEVDVASGKLTWEYINNHDISTFLDRRGVSQEQGSIARVGVFSVRYVSRPSFLESGM